MGLQQGAANILEVLGVSAREDVISNLLRYCIVAAPPFRAVFLKSVCGIDPSDGTDVRAHTRVSTGSAGVPDLVIAVAGPGRKQIIILENKLKADEGGDQTERYSSAECVQAVQERLGWSGTQVDARFIFLTLFPGQQPRAGTFRAVTYQELLVGAREVPVLEDPLAKMLWGALEQLLEGFYANAALDSDEVLLARLTASAPLEGNFLGFSRFVNSIPLPEGLRIDPPWRSSARGRRFFGTTISRPSWQSEEMRQDQENEGVWHLGPGRHFTIHIEPQFHNLKGMLEVYVHYEVNPYEGVAWVAANVPPTEYAAYSEDRRKFAEALGAKRICGLTLGGRTNQLGKAKLNLEGRTVREAREAIGDLIGRVAKAMDEILATAASSSS